MNFLKLALILFFLSASSISAQTVCYGVNCEPIRIYENGVEKTQIEYVNEKYRETGHPEPITKEFLENQAKPKLTKEETHKTIVDQAGTDRETNPFRPQIESSDSLKLHELSLGACLIERSSNPKVFYKIVELDRNSGKVRYVKENEIHENMLYSRIVFFNRDEANELKNLRFWPCSRTPHLSDNEYVRLCSAEMTASGVHYCPERSQYDNSKFVK